jgi:hypothetical protein
MNFHPHKIQLLPSYSGMEGNLGSMDWEPISPNIDCKRTPLEPGQAAEQSGRRSIRLKGFDYPLRGRCSQAGGYYVTIVTYGRDCLFGEVVSGGMRVDALGMIAQECWGEIPVHFPNVDVDVFVVMPNHVHGIIFIHELNRAGTDTLPPVGARHIVTESMRQISFVLDIPFDNNA